MDYGQAIPIFVPLMGLLLSILQKKLIQIYLNCHWISRDFIIRHMLCLLHCSTARNSLCSSDTLWQHGSGSTLAQVMAWCMMAPSHYLSQCRLIISKVQFRRRHHSQPSTTKISLNITHLKCHLNLPRPMSYLCSMYLHLFLLYSINSIKWASIASINPMIKFNKYQW